MGRGPWDRAAQTGPVPHPHPAPPVEKGYGVGGCCGQERQEGGGSGGGRAQGEEQKIQAQVGESKPNPNFKPYLRCLTSGEPDLGKGQERKKEGEKRRKKESKKGRNKENTSHQKQPEGGEKKPLVPQFKTLLTCDRHRGKPPAQKLRRGAPMPKQRGNKGG